LTTNNLQHIIKARQQLIVDYGKPGKVILVTSPNNLGYRPYGGTVEPEFDAGSRRRKKSV
jgi:hypothetical protein